MEEKIQRIIPAVAPTPDLPHANYDLNLSALKWSHSPGTQSGMFQYHAKWDLHMRNISRIPQTTSSGNVKGSQKKGRTLPKDCYRDGT
jgi:hypothetical protein